MVTIAHISDLHCSSAKHGKTGFDSKKLEGCIKEVNKLKPDVVTVTGDLTMFAFKNEYAMVKRYLDRIESEKLIIPGNHDARYSGYDYFEEFFGYGNVTLKIPGISIVGIDTTIPDLDEGNIGRGKLRWLTNTLKKLPKKNKKIVAMHHHLISIPGTGRERSTITNGGTVMEALINIGVDMVLCGHRHIPYSWLLNNITIVNAGSASAMKLRANINNSYNIININDSSIDITLKEIGKKPQNLARYDKLDNGKGWFIREE
jgi:3',5'-cyclic AMP phosphodiesterase CpdA